MKVIQDAQKMQRWALQMRLKKKRMALVPTMGALHRGHEALIERARKDADCVIVSIYVNPTQFGPKEDFNKYPRMIEHDLRICRRLGVDVVFCPDTLYLADHSTWVDEQDCSRGRCGRFRKGHFRGVGTIVVKLFLICQPDLAYFGQKDAQQVDVVCRIVRDLNFPIRVIAVETVRDEDGVALSSRNAYLSSIDRSRVQVFARLLKEAVSKKAPVSWFKKNLSKQAGISLEYAEISNGRLCAAVRVGSTRLIDNVAMPRIKN
jgi:pantoate--beta-alanine ligase